MITTKTRNAVCLTALLAAAGFMTAAQAQPDAAATDAAKAAAPQAAPAAQAVPANVDAAAADAALRKRLQAVVAAMDGKSKLAANNFNEEFLKNSPIDTVQKALDSVRTGVVDAYADSLAPVFWYLIPFLLVAFVIACFLRQIPLAHEAGMVARGEAVTEEQLTHAAGAQPHPAETGSRPAP